MAYAYEEVTIDSQDYTVLAGLTYAQNYVAGGMHGATFRELDAEDQSRYLVDMTRVMDRQLWRGDKTDADQDHSWPRKSTGITGVTDDVIPQGIIDATVEGAIALSEGASFESEPTGAAAPIQSLKAGSVSLTYFRGASSGLARFPLIIQELLRPYFGSLLAGGYASSTGTDATSVTERDFSLNSGM